MALYHHIVAAVASAGLLLAAGAAIAENERGPECGWDFAGQRFVQGGAPAWVSGGGSPEFAATFIGDDGQDWLILHHCPSGRYILAAAKEAEADRIGERFEFLLDTDTKYTMDEIGTELAALGAGVRRGQGDIGRCDCDLLASISR